MNFTEKKTTTLSWRTLTVAILTGLAALSPVLIFIFVPEIVTNRSPASLIENAAVPPTQENLSAPIDSDRPLTPVGKPVHLTIPKINVDSDVEYVGLTSGGAMDVPKGPDVAWFDLGPRPGEDGTAVIAGHYGIKDGKGSVFDNLYKLRKGDKVYIKDDKGMTISFVVRETRRYNPKDDASDVFGTNVGKSHLNLITCEGVWDKVSQSYSERLVVFTDKE